MQSAKCPGQDRRNWKPDDIFEHKCPHCDAAVEFWKTDARVKCPQCKEYIMNPKFNLGCALYCAYAEQCVGDISQILEQRPEALRDRLELEVRRYFIGESERLKYTLEAGEIASYLLEKEQEVEPPVIMGAVLTHDSGYAQCKELYQDEQQLEACIREKSTEIAAKIMKELKMPRPVQEKVQQLIAAETGDHEANAELFQDIKELAAAKVAAQDKSLSSAARQDVMNNLRRDSSRALAETYCS